MVKTRVFRSLKKISPRLQKKTENKSFTGLVDTFLVSFCERNIENLIRS